MNLQLPSTILSTSLIVEDKIYIEVEGLLSIDRYVSSNQSVFAQFQSWSENQYWPNATDVAVPLNAQCDGNAVLFDGQLGNWCSYDQGILRYGATAVETIRLPIISSAGGFGELPQLFLAFGGGDSPVVIDEDNVAVSTRLSVLNMQPGLSTLWVKGLIPYAFGNDSAIRVTHDGQYNELESLESLQELDDVVLGFISLDYGEKLSASGENE
ncbi:MAG: hypothetical protein VXY53_08460, partial [Candidatus Thermoplasmatota archaeon]|nr:hypothetical protein [Candidatus Thermoplasmatota archaeon]